MSTNSFGHEGKAATSRVNPEGVSSCVWVDAGLVSYKLCDRDFECDDCPFDQAMRQESRRRSPGNLPENGYARGRLSEAALNSIGTFSELVKAFLNHSPEETLPAGRFYSRNHLWAMKIEGGRYRVGVDSYVGSLFHNPLGVILPQVGTTSKRNAPLAWIVLEDGTVAARSPLDGEISRGNYRLREYPELMNSDPYESGWVCEVAAVDDAIVRSRCFDNKAAKKLFDDQVVELEQSIVANLEHRADQLGTTMMDGGTKPNSLKELVGAQRYVSLVKRLLSLEK